MKKISLERAGLHYLERYASTEAGVRSVLLRKIDRAARDGRCDADEAAVWVDEIVQKFVRLGYVDDASFARAKAGSLRRRGDSAAKIRMTPARKGVDRDLIDEALGAEDTDTAGPDGDAEFIAACRFARRRRLGPMRLEETRADMRQKDLAALARAGFSMDVAIRVLDLETAEEPPASGWSAAVTDVRRETEIFTRRAWTPGNH